MKRIEFGELRIGPIAREHINDCLDRNWISMGPKVELLEQEFAKIMGTRYAVAMSSGTTALTAMTLALPEICKRKVVRGKSNVICPALGFIANSSAIVSGRLIPRPVEIKYEDLNIDENLVEESIDEDTVAIYAIGTMGCPSNMDRLKKIADDHDLVLFEDACFTPGNEIFTSEGLKLVEDIKVGDRVITHCGRFRPVTDVMVSDYDGDVCEIDSRGYQKTICMTANHPVFRACTSDIRVGIASSGYCRADQLSIKDYLLIPKYSETKDIEYWDMSQYPYESTNSKWSKIYKTREMNKIEVNSHLMNIIGWYLAEGHTYRQHVEFSLYHKEYDNINSLKESLQYFGFECSEKTEKKVLRICVFHKQLKTFLGQNFGNGSKNKKIPEWVINLPNSKIEKLLDSYRKGDGNRCGSGDNLFKITSISYNLLYAVRIICSKLGYTSGINQVAKAGKSNICGREVNCQDKFQVRYNTDPSRNKIERRLFSNDCGVYCNIVNINKKKYTGKVYNFTVEEDHTYCVGGGFLVHNCENYGSKINGEFSHKRAIAGCSSLYTAHLVVASEGSLIYTDNENLRDLMKSIRSHGRHPDSQFFDHIRFGSNFKMTDLAASIGLEGVSQFNENITARKKNWQKLVDFTEQFKKYAWFSNEPDGVEVMPHGFSITIKPDSGLDINNLIRIFDEANIHWKKNFGTIYTHPAMSEFKYKDCPRAEWCGSNGVHLGCHRFLSLLDIDRMCNSLEKFFIIGN